MILLPGTQRLSQDKDPYGASPKPTQTVPVEPKPEEESEYEESEYETETEEEEEEEAAAAGAGQNGEAAAAKVNGSTHYEENAERALEEAVVQNGEEHNLDYIDEEDNEDEKPVSSPRLNR